MDAVCAAYASAHNVHFGEPNAGLGNARTATLTGAGLVGVRTPFAGEDVLALEEATSALDNATEDVVTTVRDCDTRFARAHAMPMDSGRNDVLVAERTTFRALARALRYLVATTCKLDGKTLSHSVPGVRPDVAYWRATNRSSLGNT